MQITEGVYPNCGNYYSCHLRLWVRVGLDLPTNVVCHDSVWRFGYFSPAGFVLEHIDLVVEGDRPLGEVMDLATAGSLRPTIHYESYPNCASGCEGGYNATIYDCGGQDHPWPLTSLESRATVVVDHIPAALPATASDIYCWSNSNSTGAAAALSCGGSSRVADNALFFSVESAPADGLGYFLFSLAAADVPVFGGGQGRLCLGGSILRLSSDVLRANGAGQVAYHIDLTSLPGWVQFAPGQTGHFQYWFRDANPGSTSNTSHGVFVQFS